MRQPRSPCDGRPTSCLLAGRVLRVRSRLRRRRPGAGPCRIARGVRKASESRPVQKPARLVRAPCARVHGDDRLFWIEIIHRRLLGREFKVRLIGIYYLFSVQGLQHHSCQRATKNSELRRRPMPSWLRIQPVQGKFVFNTMQRSILSHGEIDRDRCMDFCQCIFFT